MKRCVFTKSELASCSSELHAKVFIRDKLIKHGFVVSEDGTIQEPHTRRMDSYEQELIFEGGSTELGRSEGTPQMSCDSYKGRVSGATSGRISGQSPNTSVNSPRGSGRENESVGS